jgi:hypothetical protein
VEGEPLKRHSLETIDPFTTIINEMKGYTMKSKKDEQDDFVNACMSRLHERYPDQEQRLAICFSEYENQ